MARAVLRRERGSLGISRAPAHPWPGIGWGLVPELENSLWFLQGQIILPACGGKGGEPSCPSTGFDGNCLPVPNDR